MRSSLVVEYFCRRRGLIDGVGEVSSWACLCRRGGRDVFQVSRAWLLRSSPVWFLIAGVWVLRSSSQACRGVFQVARAWWLRSSPVWWGVSSSACEWFQVLRSVVFVIFSCSSCFFTRFYFVLEHFHVLFLFILFLLHFFSFFGCSSIGVVTGFLCKSAMFVYCF